MSPTKARDPIPVKERNKAYYQLKFTHGLPPGTDSFDQFEKNPRHPRAPATPKRELPALPPLSERHGKWISKYLDTLDPETEYDQIIRTAMWFYGGDFQTAIGYACVFVWLVTTPAGAAAIHGRKVTVRGHQRYYETQMFNLHWVHWGSGSAETREYCEKINRTHAQVWKSVPGAFAHPWEAQAAIILLSWYEQFMRRTVGASNDMHPQVQMAWPAWGERVTGWFKAEPGDGSLSFGINYPRDFKEVEEFCEWYCNFDFDDQRNAEDIQKTHETAESFIHQFCELWFPRHLQFLGRGIILTLLPKNIRRKARLEDPHFVLKIFTKFAFRAIFELQDWMSDPVQPPIANFYKDIQEWDLSKIDARETGYRDQQAHRLQLFGRTVAFCVLGFLVLLYYIRR
ncbi:hypothetical protein LTR84_006340 [Exophiala bonariae]|uniref:ER-bound oxygenase mpaB/mpaB'/Rubber oxygenase catalytic domain-containing protein n=1 Tax=Exophiala bonariae TaxID=1690606 RepID=A0AAV9N4E5_9EURO|nr:hypothetical protein LTR84_006340 [Exophiala bonariae]